MKKFLLAVAAALLSLTANAQETMWGITGGLNVSSVNGDYNKIDHKGKAGFNVGVKAEFDIAEPFFVEGSALLSGKGFKLKMDEDLSGALNLEDGEDEFKVNLWYLHIPVNFGYKFNINDNMAVAPKVGVFVDLGLWGNDDNDNNPYTDYDSPKCNPYLEDENFNRFDFGFGLGANFWVAKHFEVSTGYELGMVKQYKKDSNSRNWYLNLAFLF